MDNQKQQIVDRLKQANNVLVTVSTNPSVDQLSAAIGFTLLLNKLGKHGTAVFSGEVPSVLEFLEPDKTIEKNTDSLRDFIIALDKSKADKLRYKVEESHVKIFITPYRTSITEKDLDFSQGDFNVDIVIALGVQDPKDLDQAITAHGRILHDATVVSVSTQGGSTIGSINWAQPDASSLGELLAKLCDDLGQNLLDDQIATAFLTGIVAETDRFSNAKTSAETMTISAKLMAAGANQQLVATKLQEPTANSSDEQPPTDDADKTEKTGKSKSKGKKQEAVETPTDEPAAEATEQDDIAEQKESTDGSLQIEHDKKDAAAADGSTGEAETTAEPEQEIEHIQIDEQGTLHNLEVSESKPAAESAEQTATEEPKSEPETPAVDNPKLIFDPPSRGGTLTANAFPPVLDPSTDPLTPLATPQPILNHDSAAAAQAPLPTLDLPTLDTQPPAGPALVPLAAAPTDNAVEPQLVAVAPEEAEKVEQTLNDIEKTLQDEPAAPVAEADVSDAREAVQGALNSEPEPRLEPVAALGAQPVELDLDHETDGVEASVVPPELAPVSAPADPQIPPELQPLEPAAPPIDSTPPPPAVPPPILPPLPGLDAIDPNNPPLTPPKA